MKILVSPHTTCVVRLLGNLVNRWQKTVWRIVVSRARQARLELVGRGNGSGVYEGPKFDAGNPSAIQRQRARPTTARSYALELLSVAMPDFSGLLVWGKAQTRTLDRIWE